MQSYDVTQNVQQFAQKMAEIRASAMGCELLIPAPPNDEELDVDMVNVSYTPGGATAGETLPHAENLFDCGRSEGWYYHDNLAPTKV